MTVTGFIFFIAVALVIKNCALLPLLCLWLWDLCVKLGRGTAGLRKDEIKVCFFLLNSEEDARIVVVGYKDIRYIYKGSVTEDLYIEIHIHSIGRMRANEKKLTREHYIELKDATGCNRSFYFIFIFCCCPYSFELKHFFLLLPLYLDTGVCVCMCVYVFLWCDSPFCEAGRWEPQGD